MGKRVYEEENINNIALAIQRLTGITEQFTVADMPEIIDTYINPRDLSNTRKVKITIYGVSAELMSLTAVSFVNPRTEEYYVYGPGNENATSNTTWDTSYHRNLNQTLLDNNILSNPAEVASGGFSTPVILEIDFPDGIDLTNYTDIEFDRGTSCTYYRRGPNKISVDVKTGDSPYYTNLISKKVLSWPDISRDELPVFARIPLFNSYRYIKLIVHENQIFEGKTLNTSSALSRIEFLDKNNNVYPYTNSEIYEDSFLKSYYHIPTELINVTELLTYSHTVIDSLPLYVIIDTVDGIDFNTYKKFKMYINKIDGTDIKRMTSKDISIQISEDPTFYIYDTKVNHAIRVLQGADWVPYGTLFLLDI